jgi:cysteine synthase A
VLPTPLTPIRLQSGGPSIWCKLEFLNPSGSTKDRIAGFILNKAAAEGKLSPGRVVVEASSGSTSIAFALACARQGLRFIAVMPEGVSNERVLMIRAFGGEVRFTPREAGLRGAIAESERVAEETGGFLPRQFSNPDNAAAQEAGAGREILEQIPGGRVDAIVSGVGTGGTIVGLYNALRKSNPELRAVLARPVDMSDPPEAECCSFSSQIPGVVDGVSQIFRNADFASLTTIEVRQEQAIAAARELIRRGFPVGPSSGLNYAAAVSAARKLVIEAQVVTVFPDRMERYFTTRLFDPFR